MITIKGILKLKTFGHNGAYLVECKGVDRWFPKRFSKDNFNDTFDIAEWLYNKNPEYYEIDSSKTKK